MLLRWGFLIASIFAWCIYVTAAIKPSPKLKPIIKQVNCQKYVFHPNCRGSQMRKRFSNIPDYDNTEPACVCPNYKKNNNNAIDSLSSSKLLEALFDKGFDANTIYDAYMATSDRRTDFNINRDRSSQRRKSLQESLDLGTLDLDEDY